MNDNGFTRILTTISKKGSSITNTKLNGSAFTFNQMLHFVHKRPTAKLLAEDRVHLLSVSFS